MKLKDINDFLELENAKEICGTSEKDIIKMLTEMDSKYQKAIAAFVYFPSLK